MEWSIRELGALGELLGSVAVLVTLVYVALQIRQTNENARANVEGQMGLWGWCRTRRSHFGGNQGSFKHLQSSLGM
jgi:hypothetical protein